MTEKLSLGVEIEKSMIQDSVTNIVAASIATALGDKEALVAKAVKDVISSYVNLEGKPCKKSDWNAKPYIQYLADRCIVDATRRLIEETVREHQKDFEDAVKKELSSPKFRKSVAESFVEEILNSAKSSWKMPVTVNILPCKGD